MREYTFREPAISWLKENGFDEKDIGELQKILCMIQMHKNVEDPIIIMPKNASSKVSALIYLLSSVTDEKGRPICFDEKGFIDIPEETQAYFKEGIELQKLEDAFTSLQKVKFGRQHSRPKRRGSVLDERY